MGKKKDEPPSDEEMISVDVEESPSSAHKKHKKHKKKHKKKKSHGPGEDYSSELASSELGSQSDTGKPSIKLKIKIGGQTFGEKSVNKDVLSPPGEDKKKKPDKPAGWDNSAEPTFNTKKAGDDTSDEEREWLTALEAGELDDYGRVKKCKDTKLLTARQRSLLHGDKPEELLQLPTGYKQVEMTEEQLERRQERAKKRRQQAHEKREKDRKQTMERLLKKQDTKIKTGKGKGARKQQHPGIRYLNNQNKITISVPQNIKFPFAPQTAQPPKPAVACGIKGCSNVKKYCCSKTGLPLCSLQCFRKNKALHPAVFTAIAAT